MFQLSPEETARALPKATFSVLLPIQHERIDEAYSVSHQRKSSWALWCDPGPSVMMKCPWRTGNILETPEGIIALILRIEAVKNGLVWCWKLHLEIG
jgi:hypothetical protein